MDRSARITRGRTPKGTRAVGESGELDTGEAEGDRGTEGRRRETEGQRDGGGGGGRQRDKGREGDLINPGAHLKRCKAGMMRFPHALRQTSGLAPGPPIPTLSTQGPSRGGTRSAPPQGYPLAAANSASSSWSSSALGPASPIESHVAPEPCR
eukprot:1131963-Prorocentrum_minimum.AAC.1